MWQGYVRQILRKKLQDNRKKNPAFSLRALARKLELSPGALSEVLNGKRKLSRQGTARVLEKIPLEPAERAKLAQLLDHDRTDVRVLLTPQVSELVARWHYFALLSLFELDRPPRTPRTMAKALNLPLAKVEDALETLIELGFLGKGTDGSYLYFGQHFTTTDNVPSAAIRAAHVEDMRLAKQALSGLSSDERDFTSITFAGNKKNLTKAKKEVRRFRDRIYTLMAGPEKNHVYKMSVQLYPVGFSEEE